MNIVDEIKSKLPISTLLGHDRQINCPLGTHEDKNPSCALDHHKNLFHCHSCSEGGDILTLLEKRDGKSFQQALQELAAQAGVSLRRDGSVEQREKDQKTQAALAYAVEHYHQNLLNHQGGLAYWERRGISLETIKKMKLGWSDGRFLEHLQNERKSIDDFIQAGLIRVEGAKTFDYFDIRHIVPTVNVGRVQTISGRQTDLSTSEQKYKHLSGGKIDFFYNQSAIGKKTWLFEGHPDTLTGIQIGLPAVGIIGTGGMCQPQAFAKCEEIYICPDNDAPGKRAAGKWAEAILKHNKKVVIKFVVLPDGINDFNEWYLQYKANLNNAFAELMEGVQDFISYSLAQLASLQDIHKVWGLLAQMNEIERDVRFSEIKQLFPSASIVTLRKAFKAWNDGERLKNIQNQNVVSVNADSQNATYLNLNFTETTAHVCLYLSVTREDTEGKELTRTEPVLIKKMVDKAPEMIFLCDTESQEGLEFPNRDIFGRWEDKSMKKFLAGESSPINTAALARKISDYFKSYIWYKESAIYDLIAFYTMATYVFRLFHAFPYLLFMGMRATGKTESMKLMEDVCFNGMESTNSSNAVIFRTVQSTAPTWIMDEVEKLNQSDDHNRELIGMLNAGYKQGGRIGRCEQNGDNKQEPKFFQVYCPKILGSTRNVEDTLRSRSIIVNTYRISKQALADHPQIDEDRAIRRARAKEIRNDLYLWMLTRFSDVRKIHKEYKRPEAIIGREWELWAPLVTLATMADEDDGGDGFNVDSFEARLIALAVKKGREKESADRDDNEDILILCNLKEIINNSELAFFDGTEPHWFSTSQAAKTLTKHLQEQGIYKEDRRVSPKNLMRILKQSGVIHDPDTQMKIIRPSLGGKRTRCFYMPEKVLDEVIESLQNYTEKIEVQK